MRSYFATSVLRSPANVGLTCDVLVGQLVAGRFRMPLDGLVDDLLELVQRHEALRVQTCRNKKSA